MNTTAQQIKTKRYKIAAISSNRGSFGHTRHIMVAEDGQAIKGDRINGKWQTPESLKVADILTFQVNNNGMPCKALEHGFELLGTFGTGVAPQDVIEQVWSPDYPNNVKK